MVIAALHPSYGQRLKKDAKKGAARAPKKLYRGVRNWWDDLNLKVQRHPMKEILVEGVK